MISKNESRIVELLMDSMKQGLIFVDSEKRIQYCNQRAKKITGIVFDVAVGHEAGVIKDGDIVIIADNRLGDDDGNLDGEELKKLNINDKNIKSGDVLLAVGVYRNKKIEPQYKFFRSHHLNTPVKLDVNYFGFHIVASIDIEARETRIQVNDNVYPLNYMRALGNVVIVDGVTGNTKFFQAKGFSVRNEAVGDLLRGTPWKAKRTEDIDVDVTGKRFLDLFDQSELTDQLFSVLSGQTSQVSNRLYDINKRPFICNIIPYENQGVFLMLRGAETLEHLVSDQNEILRQIEEKEEAFDREGDFDESAVQGFVGRSSKGREVKYMAWKASKNKFNVIITGESGTGKSHLAREIHTLGNPDAPFVEVNCNAIAPSLFESELFGYVGGAFTGARSEGRAGLFEAANKGTIFLDEIGEIPLDIQVKLLHVLQNKTIYRVGSSKPIKVDVRVITATNKNLEEEVAHGRFRQDLYYRINVFPIEIPPLRERKNDLYPLINYILQRLCDTYGLKKKQFSGEALQKMMNYNWPGNVREMENVIERAITLCDSNLIYSEHLKMNCDTSPVTMKDRLAKEEQRILEMTLLKHNGDKTETMKELDMSKTVFYDKLKKYHIHY